MKNKGKTHAEKIEAYELKLKEYEVKLKFAEVNLKVQEGNLKEKEVRYKQEQIDEKKLDVLRQSFELDGWAKRETHKLNMDKLFYYKFLMESCVVDENTTIGSEVRYKSPFDEAEILRIKNQLISFVK